MNCRACDSPNTAPVPFELPPNEPRYVRCADCGCDSSPLRYEDLRHHYNTENAIGHGSPGREVMMEHCRINCEWFLRAADPALPKTFLDVGSCDGAALDNMAKYGYVVQGFDVLVPPDTRHPVLTAEEFRADLFSRRFSAVLSREVIEHVPDAHEHLRQLVAACEPGGLVQVQTPRTLDHWNPLPYQTLHLVVFTPEQLRRMIAAAGLTVVDSMVWPQGQAYLCRK